MEGDQLAPPVGQLSKLQEPAPQADVADPPLLVTGWQVVASGVAVSSGVFRLNAAGYVTQWSSECEDLFGWTAAEASALSLADLVAAGAEFTDSSALLAEAQDHGSCDRIGWRLVRGVVRRPTAFGISPIPEWDGAEPAFLVVVRGLPDVHACNHHGSDLDPAVLSSGRLATLGRVATDVSHDLNNVLTAVRGFAGLLEKHLDSSGSAHQIWYELLRACDRGADLTGRLLGVGRAAEDTPDTDLKRVVDDVVPFFRQLLPERIEFIHSVPEDLEFVRGSSGEIELALLNLVVNARDAIEGDGCIEITATPASDGSGAFVWVRDSGCGVPSEISALVFERSFSTKAPEEGSGLGLALVREWLQAIGGSIELSPAHLGGGTAARLYLPFSERSDALDDSAADSASAEWLDAVH